MQFDFNLQPFGAQRIEAVGRFLKYRNGQGEIRVTTSKGGYIDLIPGEGIFGVDFTGISVSDRSGQVNAGTMLVGEFDFRDDNVTGTFDTVAKAEYVKEQNSFVAFGQSLGTASVHNTLGIYNPAGSGRRVIVESVEMCSIAQGGAYLYVSSYVPAETLVYGINKLSGGAASVARFSRETMAGTAAITSAAPVPGRPAVGFLYEPNESRIWKPDRPLILMPGYGLFHAPLATGTTVTQTIDYYEEAV